MNMIIDLIVKLITDGTAGRLISQSKHITLTDPALRQTRRDANSDETECTACFCINDNESVLFDLTSSYTRN